MAGAGDFSPGETSSPSPVLGTVGVAAAVGAVGAVGAAYAMAPEPVTSEPVTSAPPLPSVDVEDDLAATEFEVDTTPLGEPGPADHLDASTPAPTPSIDPVDSPFAMDSSPPTETVRDDEPELSFAPATSELSQPPVTRSDEGVEMPAAASAPIVDAAPEPVAATVPPAAASTIADEPSTEAARGLQLVFDGVPGYQQAAAIERAVGDLVEDGEVEIIEFEQGQLVLQVEAANPRALADRLMARPPLPMRLVASGQDSATFQLTAG